MDNIDERVKQIVSEQLRVSAAEVKNNHSLVPDLGADSLDLVELVMAVEDEFALEVPDEEAEKLATVQQMIDYVRGHTPAGV